MFTGERKKKTKLSPVAIILEAGFLVAMKSITVVRIPRFAQSFKMELPEEDSESLVLGLTQ